MNAFLSLLLALFLGMCLGLERSIAKKTAGMRTYALVSMGSALFIIIARYVASGSTLGSDSLLRMAAGIVTGIGFLCGGVIIFKEQRLSGLTTAAGLWVAAAIGMAAGFGLNALAIFGTIVTLFAFTVLWFVEHFITKNSDGPISDESLKS